MEGEFAPLDRDLFKERYDVSDLQEDSWHVHTDMNNYGVLDNIFDKHKVESVLNVGCGTALVKFPCFTVNVDLFVEPLRRQQHAVCADAHILPFQDEAFDLAVCIGEVSGYCQASKLLPELCRVTKQGGLVVVDFASTNSFFHLLKRSYRKLASMARMKYIGRDEVTWAYSPEYIASLLQRANMTISQVKSYHIASSLLLRIGVSEDRAARFGPADKILSKIAFVGLSGYNCIIVAQK